MKVAVISLGCDKNTVDTEMMLGILSDSGHELVYDESEADAVVINTCAFILDAKKESIDTILECGRLKNVRLTTGQGGPRFIIVAGCLAQRYKDQIVSDIPEVDAILGVQSFDELGTVLSQLEAEAGAIGAVYSDAVDAKQNPVDKEHTTRRDPIVRMAPLTDAPVSGHKRLVTTPMHYAYMKIAEGCDKRCTYCSIPGFKGGYRSVPMETLIGEAENLADRGVRELILVAQETTLYGIDLYKKRSLPELIEKLASVEGIEHLRLLYCYPEEISDELIELMKRQPKLCHYLDMPIQHASDDVLKRMGRHTDEAHLRALIERLRTEIPDICIRTTFITGFPGETHADHKKLLKFVEDMRFDRMGVFTYSPEEGTPAASMKHQVPAFLKKKRRDEIMKLQQKIVFETNKALEGRHMKVVIQGYIPEDGVSVARSYRDAPDVDGSIFVEADREYLSGTEIGVKITGFNGYDLIAIPEE